MTRHLHFTQSLEPLHGGGLGTSTTALHSQLLAQGVPSIVCSTYGDKPSQSANTTYEFRRIKPDFLFYAPELNLRRRELVAASDIVHGHGLYVGTNLLFGGEIRRQRKPLVYHVHGFFEPWILNRSRWKKRAAHWLFEEANFRHASLWRALTGKEADQIRALGIKAPIVVAPNGIRLADYAVRPKASASIATPLVPELNKNGRRALFLGRIHPKKGLALLLHAWAELRPHLADWHLVIAGPDENRHGAELRQLARKLNLEADIYFIGPVTGSPKIELLHSADLFVLPSHSEGFPMSLLEAMACAVPAVATRNCNFPEIAAADTGWECEANTRSIADVLGRAIRDSDLARKQRGENGRRLVEKRYAWPNIVSILLQACDAHC